MSHFSKLVRRTLDEVLEEQDLCHAEEACLLQEWEQPIGRLEVKILEAMIFHRSTKTDGNTAHVLVALECRFQIEELAELPLKRFEEALRFLIDFNGLN
ncbi:MAG: hypothetical protein AB7S81_00215 [Bdellovibrionales bacterium]